MLRCVAVAIRGIEPATTRVERQFSFIAFRGPKGPLASWEIGGQLNLKSNGVYGVHFGISEHAIFHGFAAERLLMR